MVKMKYEQKWPKWLKVVKILTIDQHGRIDYNDRIDQNDQIKPNWEKSGQN